MIRRLPRSREKPRRKAPERTAHTRIKAKAGAAPTAEEQRHMDRIRAIGCLVCGRPATIHHVSGSINGGRISRSHKRTAPICAVHHQIQHGPRESVEALSHAGFFKVYGIDLLAWADRAWEESCGTPC
jgi:hypothetical protein